MFTIAHLFISASVAQNEKKKHRRGELSSGYGGTAQRVLESAKQLVPQHLLSLFGFFFACPGCVRNKSGGHEEHTSS